MSSYRFDGKRAIVKFLTDPQGPGRAVLREALFADGLEWLAEECLDRWFPPHIPRQKVLVKAYRDGLVEAYGSEKVDVKIVLLGRSTTVPGHEIEREQRLDACLPLAYKEINWPQCKKDSALRSLDKVITCHTDPSANA